jgi:hypothetical protein
MNRYSLKIQVLFCFHSRRGEREGITRSASKIYFIYFKNVGPWFYIGTKNVKDGSAKLEATERYFAYFPTDPNKLRNHRIVASALVNCVTAKLDAPTCSDFQSWERLLLIRQKLPTTFLRGPIFRAHNPHTQKELLLSLGSTIVE